MSWVFGIASVWFFLSSVRSLCVYVFGKPSQQEKQSIQLEVYDCMKISAIFAIAWQVSLL